MRLLLYIFLIIVFGCHAQEKEGSYSSLSQFPAYVDLDVISRPQLKKREHYSDIVKHPRLLKHSLERNAKHKVLELRRAIDETDTTVKDYAMFGSLADPSEEKKGSWLSEQIYIMDVDKNGEEDLMFYYFRAADDAGMFLFTQHKGKYRIYKGGGYLKGIEIDSIGRFTRLLQYHYACCMYDRDHITELNFEYSEEITLKEQMWTLLIHANDTLPPSLSFQSQFVVTDSLYLQGMINKKHEIKKGTGYHGSYLLRPGDRGAIYGSIRNEQGEKWFFVIVDPVKRGRHEEGHFCGWVREEDVRTVKH